MRLLDSIRFRNASARYFAQAPLFGLADGRQPLAAGSYRYAADGTEIRFHPHLDHYHVSGDATPETVALIPVGDSPTRYIFQQSHALGTAFYGMLRFVGDEPGFTLFSPESVRLDAIRFAKGRAAAIDRHGCRFSDQNALFTALVLVSFDAPAACWRMYRPTPS
jgi:hypothetical protein